MNYIEVTFDITPYEEAVADALISELGTIGYDGFSYTDQGFTAYIPAKDYNAQAITRLEIFDFFTRNYRIETSVQEIEDQDWNKVWEENFTPIVVDDRILVRAGFHAPVPGIEYEILIEPKMSFGTGHHSTTALMLRTILDNKERITGKRVLDMGCGTGILSIPCGRLGVGQRAGTCDGRPALSRSRPVGEGAVGRRTPSRGVVSVAVAAARRTVAGRTDQPPRRRVDRLAGTTSATV